jgi:hypothetical protein
MFVFFSFFTFKDIVKAGGIMYPESTTNNEMKKKKNNKKKETRQYCYISIKNVHDCPSI